MANKEDDDVTKQVREIHPQRRGGSGGDAGASHTRIAPSRPRSPADQPDTIIHSGGSHTIIQRSGQSIEPVTDAIPPRSAQSAEVIFPVTGWLVSIAGPGKGKSRPIFEGMNSVGRNSSERIPLDFGDLEISGEKHFFVTFERKKRSFHISTGEKVNLVYLNGDVVLDSKTLKEGDEIEVGKTKLRFVPLCGPGFGWDEV
jgi:hypothetical protein